MKQNQRVVLGYQQVVDAYGRALQQPVYGYIEREAAEEAPSAHEGMEIGRVLAQGWVADRQGGMGSTTEVNAILFSDHSAAYLDASEDEWFIVDRTTGHQINLSPFSSSELNYLALTCYFLNSSGEGERNASDLIRASGRASDALRSGFSGDEVDSFVADFSQAALELIDP